MAPKLTVPDDPISAAALAEIVGSSITNVQHHVFKPLNEAGTDRTLHAVLRRLWEIRASSSANKAPDDPEEGMTEREAKRLKTAEEFRKIKRITDVAEGILVPVSEVAAALRGFLEPAQRNIESFLLNTLPKDAAGLTAGEIRNLNVPAYNAWVESLRHAIDEICKTAEQSPPPSGESTDR